MAALFHYPTSNALELQFLHILFSARYCLVFCFVFSHPRGCEVVLICISLLTNDAEHVFRCVMVIGGVSQVFEALPFFHFDFK